MEDKRIAAVMTLHRPIDLVAIGQRYPGADDAVICLECSAHHDDVPDLWPYWVVTYPCPTVRLLSKVDERPTEAKVADEMRHRIEALRNNPEARQYFDDTFNDGLAAALHQVIAWSQAHEQG